MQAPIVLNTGAIARYPLSRANRFATQSVRFADFSGQFFSQLANPLYSWQLALELLRDDEVSDWFEFYRAIKGQGAAFTFVDPWDNLLKYSEEQENAAWIKAAGVAIGKNYLLRSEEFDNSAWTKDGEGGGGAPTVTPNVSSPLAPDGTQTADQINFPSTTATEVSRIRQLATGIPNADTKTFVISVFLRASASVTIELLIHDQDGNQLVSPLVCNLNNSSWQRFELSAASGAGDTNIELRIRNTISQAAKTVYAWGAQLEYGGVSSDYTVTTTTAAELKIADPFWLAAPTAEAGSAFNLNSVYEKRGRQIVAVDVSPLSDAYLHQELTLAPGGSGSSRTKGIQFTGSLYVKQQASSPPNFILTLTDERAAESFSTSAVAPTSSWVRTVKTARYTGSNRSAATRFRIEPQAVGTFYVFGAQLEAEGIETKYKKTQAKGGVHTNCRFSGDEMQHVASALDLNSLGSLVVEEWG